MQCYPRGIDVCQFLKVVSGLEGGGGGRSKGIGLQARVDGLVELLCEVKELGRGERGWYACLFSSAWSSQFKKCVICSFPQLPDSSTAHVSTLAHQTTLKVTHVLTPTR